MSTSKKNPKKSVLPLETLSEATAAITKVKKIPLVQEFSDFIARGNVIELAVGVIIGGAFGKIVSSLVDDILMPILGVLLNGIDFSGLSLQIKDAQINYGLFLQNVVDFLIVAICIFFIVKAVNKFMRANQAKCAPTPKPKGPNIEEKQLKLLEEIRDSLAKK